MLSLLETLTAIVISTVFLLLFSLSIKLAKDREKIMKELLYETGVRFEIFLKFKCYEDKKVEVSFDDQRYMCGFGKIEKMRN